MSQTRRSLLGIRDTLVINGFILGFVFWIIGLISLSISYSKLPPVVPMFYSQIRGESQLAGKHFLFLIPAFSFLALLIHFYVARINIDSDRMFSRLITLTGMFISIIYFVGLAHILIIAL